MCGIRNRTITIDRSGEEEGQSSGGKETRISCHVDGGGWAMAASENEESSMRRGAHIAGRSL